MRVIRFLRQFNTVAAAILLVIGIIAALLVIGLTVRSDPRPFGSGSYSGSKGEMDERLFVDRLNERGEAGEYLLYHRSENYREKRDLVLVDAQDGRHRNLLGDAEKIVTDPTLVEDAGILLQVTEDAEDEKADALYSVVFVRFADFREFTIASHVGGVDYGTELGEGRFSLVLTGEEAGASRFVVFDAYTGRIAKTVPLPLSAVRKGDGDDI